MISEPTVCLWCTTEISSFIRVRPRVLHNLSAVFLKLGYHVILFNTRGVGESSGRASFTGISESQDLRAVLAWAVEEIVHLDTAVLVGYSYGSLITSMVPSPKRLHPERIKRAAHILISHPLGPMASFITFFNTAKYTSAFDQVLADPGLDVLLIYGNNDQFFSLKRYESWVARCREIRGQASENPGAPLGHGAEDETIPPTIPIANAIGVCSTTSPPTRGVDSVNPRASVSTGPRGPRKLEEKMIEHGDHFWRGSSGTYLRNAVSDWVEKL
ncbi:hypothetical protein FRB94_009267 [Tulasnella sp. JGI-2019a]|nr:hypothetical protein FRB94_009267 [Tulasnella sp. JGI-2019a]